MNGRYQHSDLTGLTLAAIVLAMVALALAPGSGQGAQRKAAVTPTAPRVVFGSLITLYCRLWNEAAQSNDPAMAAPLYAKNSGLVFYGLGETEYHGWRAYEHGVKSAVLDNAVSMQFRPGQELEVTRKGNVAWTTAILHVSILWAGGREQEFDAEQTAVWEQRDGKWLIVHEHLSSPALRPVTVGS